MIFECSSCCVCIILWQPSSHNHCFHRFYIVVIITNKHYHQHCHHFSTTTTTKGEEEQGCFNCAVTNRKQKHSTGQTKPCGFCGGGVYHMCFFGKITVFSVHPRGAQSSSLTSTHGNQECLNSCFWPKLGCFFQELTWSHLCPLTEHGQNILHNIFFIQKSGFGVSMETRDQYFCINKGTNYYYM